MNIYNNTINHKLFQAIYCTVYPISPPVVELLEILITHFVSYFASKNTIFLVMLGLGNINTL